MFTNNMLIISVKRRGDSPAELTTTSRTEIQPYLGRVCWQKTCHYDTQFVAMDSLKRESSGRRNFRVKADVFVAVLTARIIT